MKYMGSKARIAKDISPIINQLIKDNGIDIYIEPFVGGANMIQHFGKATHNNVGQVQQKQSC